MMCRYCNKVEVEWPENWKRGMKPIESDTGTEHTRDRCEDLQNVNIIKSAPSTGGGFISCGVNNCTQCTFLGNYKLYDKLQSMMRV